MKVRSGERGVKVLVLEVRGDRRNMRRQAPQQAFDPRALGLECLRPIYFEDPRTFGAGKAICARVEASSHDHHLVDAFRQRPFEGVVDEAGPNDDPDACTRPYAIDGLGHEATGHRDPGHGEDRAESCTEECVRVGIVKQASIWRKGGLERPEQSDELRVRLGPF